MGKVISNIEQQAFEQAVNDDIDAEEMERLAQNISWLLKCISSGKEHGIQNPCFVEKLDAFMLGR